MGRRRKGKQVKVHRVENRTGGIERLDDLVWLNSISFEGWDLVAAYPRGGQPFQVQFVFAREAPEGETESGSG